jgi:hypothetical protein
MTIIPAARVFDFETDTFAYPNELVWEYHFDAQTGKGWTQKRNPPPTYAHHCFVVVRSARQFFRNAEFNPHGVALGDAEYLERIRKVVQSTAVEASAPSGRVEFPGFANLREFSRARPGLLKSACGGAWQSYAQRGNWRMVLPFSRSGQAATASLLRGALAAGRLPIIHVATFPALTINHTVLLFECSGPEGNLEFQAYDPNIPERPITITFDATRRSFIFPRTHYFPGGPVNAYEIYRGLFF